MDLNPNPGNTKKAEHHTKPSAWIVVAVLIGAAILGGIALIYWDWIMFWTAVGLFGVGIAAGWAIDIMGQVSEYTTVTDVAVGNRRG